MGDPFAIGKNESITIGTEVCVKNVVKKYIISHSKASEFGVK